MKLNLSPQRPAQAYDTLPSRRRRRCSKRTATARFKCRSSGLRRAGRLSACVQPEAPAQRTFPACADARPDVDWVGGKIAARRRWRRSDLRWVVAVGFRHWYSGWLYSNAFLSPPSKGPARPGAGRGELRSVRAGERNVDVRRKWNLKVV